MHQRSADDDRPSSARVVAVANQKGGVGKTTTAVNLGAGLAEAGMNVVVVDLDPQGNASTGLGVEPARRAPTSYDVLTGRSDPRESLKETPVPGLLLIPATIDLAGAEIELVGQFGRETVLKRALEPLLHGHDVILIDCPPSFGLLSVNALAAADEVLVPLQCEYFALEGLGSLLRNLRLIQQSINPNLRLNGIVLTMFDARTKLADQVVAEIRSYFGEQVYRAVVPRSVRLSEAPGFGLPILQYDSASRGAAAYRAVAEEFMRRHAAGEAFTMREVVPAPEDAARIRGPVTENSRTLAEPSESPVSPISPISGAASAPRAAPEAEPEPARVDEGVEADAAPRRRRRWFFRRRKGGSSS